MYKDDKKSLVAVCGVALGICNVLERMPKKEASQIDPRIVEQMEVLKGMAEFVGAKPMSMEGLLDRKRIDRIMENAGIPAIPEELYEAVTTGIQLIKMIGDDENAQAEVRGDLLSVTSGDAKLEDLPVHVQLAVKTLGEFAEKERYNLSITLEKADKPSKEEPSTLAELIRALANEK